MMFIARIIAFLLIGTLLSCDGPNAELDTEVDASDRGVHNQDGFQIVLKVNNGASITPDVAVAIQLSAVNAHEMYITQESACNIGGSWESIKPFKQWTLQKTNGMNFFYVKVRNESRESDCAFTSIEHDSVAPSMQLVSPANGATLANPLELPLVGSCSEDATVSIKVNSLLTFSASCIGGAWSKTLDVSTLPSGNIAIQLKVVDQVMNASSIQNFSFTK